MATRHNATSELPVEIFDHLVRCDVKLPLERFREAMVEAAQCRGFVCQCEMRLHL